MCNAEKNGYEANIAQCFVSLAFSVLVTHTPQPCDTLSIRVVIVSHQKVQDWHLLLLAAGIVMIEVLFTIPLLSLTFVNGDARLIRDSENSAFTNVSRVRVFQKILRLSIFGSTGGRFVRENQH